jgi:uncharacterized membrane protein YbhN (UPF0104 family)
VTLLRKRWVELACLAFGLAILGVTVWQIGVASLIADLRLIGWGLVVILLVESLNVGVNTWGWGLAFPPGERPVSPRRLLAARMAGDGVNYLTPSATVGGELLRVRLLGRSAPIGVRWASVSVAKLGQTVAQAVFILLALALVLPRFGEVTPWAAVLAAGGGAVLICVGFGWVVSRGMWASFQDVAGRLGLAHRIPARWAGPGRELDAALTRLGVVRLGGSLVCFVAGWAVGAAEIYLILWWLGGTVDWQTALAVETGSVLIDGILFFVPGKIGTQEGGKVVIFAALGLDPARGLTVGVVRRIRELIYAGLGLAALALLAVIRAPRRRRVLAHRTESS